MFLLPHSVGGYTLHRKLGTGGVAESYLGVHDAAGGRQVVVRRVLPFVLRDPARLASVEARIRDLSGVRHPFLVHVAEHVVNGEEHFLVEEYVQGCTLEQVLNWCRQSGQMVPHNVFLSIATQICNGLEALHGRTGKGSSAEHVLHLGLKPSAIFLTPEGKVLVGSYGLTRSPTQFPQGGVAGPVPARMEYLSPEQTHPDQKLTPASDIFALGAMLYELLTLESLFRAESNLQTIHRLRRAEVTQPLLKVKERMPGLDKVLFRALALNPRHRYQRAFVLREDLRGLMAGYSFATIGEDTRAFLAPFSQGGPIGGGYVAGLDDAPDAPADGNPGNEPSTRIDADPMSTAAAAASALAAKVAAERAAQAAPENTEHTDVGGDPDLTPLPEFGEARPAFPTLAPAPSSRTWQPESLEPEPAQAAGRWSPGVPAPDTTGIHLMGSVPPPEPLMAPPSGALPAMSASSTLSPDEQPTIGSLDAEGGRELSQESFADNTVGRLPKPKKEKKSRKDSKGRSKVHPNTLAEDGPLETDEHDGSGEPSFVNFAPQAHVPGETDASAVVMPSLAARTAPPPVASDGFAGAAVAAGAGVAAGAAAAAADRPSPPPVAKPEAAPPPAPAPPVRSAVSLSPQPSPTFDVLDEPPPPNRGPLFALVAMGALAAVVLCAGMSWYGFRTSGTPSEVAVAAEAPKVKATEDEAAAVLAATTDVVPPTAEEIAAAEKAAAEQAAATAKASEEAAAKAEADAKAAEAAAAALAAKEAAAKEAAAKAAKPAATSAPVAKTPRAEPTESERRAAEADRLAKAESARLAKERADADKLAKAEAARVAKERADADKLAKAEAARVAKEAAARESAAKAAAATAAKSTAPKSSASSTSKLAAPAVAVAPVEPEVVSPSLDGYVDAAKKGKLSAEDVSALERTPTTDSQYTRARSLLLLNAQKKSDDAGVRKYLDQAMVLPENQYNPVLLADYARWHVNHGEYDKALDKAGKAERYWARLPTELVFSKKAEIYEISAAAWQGKFYKSGEDLELLDNAVRGWEKYRGHAASKDRADLVKKADTELAKLADVRARIQ